MNHTIEVEVTPDRLRDASLLEKLPTETLFHLAKSCHYVELTAGETLFHQGDPGDALYILEEGQIHVLRKYPNGNEVILATQSPFYAVGELSMLAGQPRTGSVVAVSDSTLIALPRQDFIQACHTSPNMTLDMLTHLGSRLYQVNLMVREHALQHLEPRIANMLAVLSGGRAS